MGVVVLVVCQLQAVAMASLKQLNPNSEIAHSAHALMMNIGAAQGLQEVLKTNLGPRGTIKMLVSGAGDIKLTKDGNVLLHEMQIQHPTACLIARAATSQDDITGDGITSTVLIIGEILKQCERYLAEGVHPRILADGFELGKEEALRVLNEMKVPASIDDRELLLSVAKTSLRTKLRTDMADQLTPIVVDSILTIKKDETPVDLFMVEIMTMQHRSDSDSKLVKGLVMDHGARHPDMPKRLENAFILTCNVSMEYEESEVNAGFFYTSAEERQALVNSERTKTDAVVMKVIELKREVCKNGEGFVVVNAKGIDPLSLDMLARENILGLRRAKRRNMERLTLACGGSPINSVEDLTPDVLGKAGLVYEQVLGEDKYTFVEGVENPFSCTILLKGPNKHTIAQLKDAVRDGLRAVNNVVVDKSVVAGGGAFEIAAHEALRQFQLSVPGRAKLGVSALAEALLVIPKTLATNSGFDGQDTVLNLLDAHRAGLNVGVDVQSGEPLDTAEEGIWDNYRVKRQQLNTSVVLATQLVLVDEVLKAGRYTRSAGPPR